MLGKKDNNQETAILLVDDRPENLLAMEAVLEPLGYSTATARSGREALKYLLTYKVALIVLDVRMPDMDGFETASLIQQRERTRYVPILFVTANPVDERDLFRARMAGGVDYVAQPIRPDDLARKVRLILEQTHGPALKDSTRRRPHAHRFGSHCARFGFDGGI